MDGHFSGQKPSAYSAVESEDCQVCAQGRGSRNMARRLIRTIYGADFFQLSLNSSSCTKEYRLCACVLRVEGRAKAAQLHTLARQGPQPFSQALSRAHVLEVSQTSSRTKLTSFTTFPLRHTHHHLYCHTHSHLHQTDNSWGHRHHCLQQQQCRPYAKKGIYVIGQG